MITGNSRLGLIAALLFAASAAQAQPGATEAARDVVVELHEGLVAAAGEASLAERYEALGPLVARTHDLEYVARLSIRRYWDELSEEQHRRFVAAFERLSVMNYASRFANVSKDTFKLLGSEDGGGGRIEVRAAIARADADDVSLDYLLHSTADGWRIINILADGVSDLALKRAEYQRILSAGTIDDLIAEIEAQTARLQ